MIEQENLSLFDPKYEEFQPWGSRVMLKINTWLIGCMRFVTLPLQKGLEILDGTRQIRYDLERLELRERRRLAFQERGKEYNETKSEFS